MGAQPADPIVLSVPTQPQPQNAPELYLDLMKKVLTRALIASGRDRRTISPQGPKSWVLHHLNRLALHYDLEAVRLMRSSPRDYVESVHETMNRLEDAETMLGTRQLDQMQQCIVDVLTRNVPGD